jgi:signal transduction histidine kinase
MNQQGSFTNALVKDAVVTLLFGALSVILGMIQFQTPGFEGSYSDLREIALLISLFHIRKVLFIIPLCLITIIWIPADAPVLPTFIMHVIPLMIIWYAHQWIERQTITNIMKGVTWFVVAIIYYTLLLFPILIISYQFIGLNNQQGFGDAYLSVLSSGKFEMIATALVSSLYFVQHEIRKSLEHTNKNLEVIVHERTQELIAANNEWQTVNEELTSSNEEIKSLNENLERIIKERTEKINYQLIQLSKYAHMNSHEVRAPLARILGLLTLIKKEECKECKESKIELLQKLYISSEELDQVIKKMNRLLEQEIQTDE